MNCILCGNKMDVQNYEGVDIDICKNCGGMWLDKGEIERIVNTRTARFSLEGIEDVIKSAAAEQQSYRDLLKDIKSFKRDIDFEKLSDEQITQIFKKRWGINRNLKCPKCLKLLEEVNYAGVGVTLDVCPDKHGFWLDKDELGKVQIMMEYYNKTAEPMRKIRKLKLGWFDFICKVVKDIIP